jgi:transposase
MVSLLGLSYAQVSHLATVQYGLNLSDGEIANILSSQHLKWLSAYERIKAGIRAAPIKHYDETPWPITAIDNSGYAWVMSDANKPDTIYELATSRGAKHIQGLHNSSIGVNSKNERSRDSEGTSESSKNNENDKNNVYITDDYVAYRNLTGKQQLCWAHLYRNIRDLASNSNLLKSKRQRVLVEYWYKEFTSIYTGLRAALAETYDKQQRQRVASELWRRTKQLAEHSTKTKEPDKLRKLKAQILRAGKQRLFTCLIHDTPCDNNRAERDLRQLVLKRKRSLGSKTTKGAKALSTVLSICTTIWRRQQEGYFGGLAGV